MARELTQLDLLRELAPVAEDNVNRHLKIAKNWNPHDYVPWDEGRNFAALGGVDYDPEQSQLCLLYTSPSPRDATLSRMPSSA